VLSAHSPIVFQIEADSTRNERLRRQGPKLIASIEDDELHAERRLARATSSSAPRQAIDRPGSAIVGMPLIERVSRPA